MCYNNQNETPLHKLLRNENASKSAALLISNGSDVNFVSNDGVSSHLSIISYESPLFVACGNSDIKTVKLLIDKGANVNDENNCGITPLHNSCSKGKFYISKLLIENGADINAIDNKGEHVLGCACYTDSIYLVKYLLAKGCDVNEKNIPSFFFHFHLMIFHRSTFGFS